MAKTILAQAMLMIISSFIVSANSLAIDVQPQFVRPNDENVVFTCAGGNDTEEIANKMLRMRLMKVDGNDKWAEVAVLLFNGSIHMTDVNATAVGRLGYAFDSYLAVTWSVAPEDIHGIYRCEAIKLTRTGEVVEEQSRDLEVKSLPTDVSLSLRRLELFEKRLIGKLNETLFLAMESSETHLSSALNSEFGDLKEYLDNKTAIDMRIPEEDVESISWPEGNFTLLMPSDGCPKRPSAWIKSFQRNKAKPGDKYYPIDVPLHLANPHKKNGFIYRQFCSLPASPERTKPWPSGRYCLYTMSYSSFCPAGFKFVKAIYTVESDDRNLFVTYFQNQGQAIGNDKGLTASRFCCRHDGIASAPIDLPVSHPFYLFRLGGKCQEVRGMDVTQDIFMVDTVDNDNAENKWAYLDGDSHADVSFKPYKEELCYYSRKRE